MFTDAGAGFFYAVRLAEVCCTMKGQPVLVAIDLGAESCRVSLLHWHEGVPEIRMVHRFGNGPVAEGKELHWDLIRICRELEVGLRRVAELVPGAVDAIGVTGWAVDYVRLDAHGSPIGQPFCYRDPRNVAAMEALHRAIPASEIYARAGVQIQPINTIYQLYADKKTDRAHAPWVSLPEYILYWLGAPRVAEFTNATHTGLVDPSKRQWSAELFAAAGLELELAPRLVLPGTLLGPMHGEWSRIPQFAHTQLIAPACHDTASAVAGIPAKSGDWAYISSGTWSLVGTVLTESHRTERACADGFTNLGAAGGKVLFHRGLVGMWLLRQCMNRWDQDQGWELNDLVQEAAKVPAPDALLDLDDPAFALPGDMPVRINSQRTPKGLQPLPPGCAAAPHYASLIFHSLANRYAVVLREIEEITGRHPERICVVGGGNRNAMLNSLTSQVTGLPVERCSVESSTLGNFVLQWARLEEGKDGVSSEAIAECAARLAAAPIQS